MGEQLIKAYSISVPNENTELNIDNLYMNGKYIISEQRTSAFSYSSSNKDSIQIYAVCDGMEGKMGEDAAVPPTAVMQVLKVLQKRLKEEQNLTIEKARDMIESFVTDTNNKIQLFKESVGKKDLGSTFASLFIFGNKAFTVNIGDSRVYSFKNNRLRQLTEDHLESNSLVQLGILNKEQADVHKSRSKVTRFFGYDDEEYAINADFSNIFTLEQGDILILATDGVTDVLRNDQIEEIIRVNSKDEVVLGKEIMNKVNNKLMDRTLMILNVDEVLDRPIISEDRNSGFMGMGEESFVLDENKKKYIKIGIGVIVAIICMFLVISALSSTLKKKEPSSVLPEEEGKGTTIENENREIGGSSGDDQNKDKDNGNQQGLPDDDPGHTEGTGNKDDLDEGVTDTDKSDNKGTELEESSSNIEDGDSEDSVIKESDIPEYYVVKQGDNLYNIAMEYYKDNSMIEKLQYYNGVEKRNEIYVGQKLLLPSKDQAIEYKVKEGDTFFNISKKFYGNHNKVEEIMKANGINNADDLIIGSTILIP